MVHAVKLLYREFKTKAKYNGLTLVHNIVNQLKDAMQLAGWQTLKTMTKLLLTWQMQVFSCNDLFQN